MAIVSLGDANSILRIEKSKLHGEVLLSGAKNSGLPLLAASLLTSGTVALSNFPADLLDARVQLEMMRVLGKRTRLDGQNTLVVDEGDGIGRVLTWQGRTTRSTLLILGALLARGGSGKVPLPGGCNLGDRKYDIHVMAMEQMGARVWQEGEYLCAEASADRLIGCELELPIRSTGATENAILMGALAKGVTRVWNPHIRPEILDLIDLLRKMGAEIIVHGQEHIEIQGQQSLYGASHRVIADNMEAVTWLCAAMMTRGDLTIHDFPWNDMEVVLAHLRAAGARIYRCDSSAIVRGGKCYPIEISTGPHPGINSDVQPILAAWASCARGESKIVDLRFPGRYGYADEMAKMGVSSRQDLGVLAINGNGGVLQGATVRALDLRAGAALALCGLVANGVTEIRDAWQISRGYERFVEKLTGLGGVASIVGVADGACN